jgi:NAD(P)-dependent dehydrogenase (short-subunit alcohol dehydrogenase family)
MKTTPENRGVLVVAPADALGYALVLGALESGATVAFCPLDSPTFSLLNAAPNCRERLFCLAASAQSENAQSENAQSENAQSETEIEELFDAALDVLPALSTVVLCVPGASTLEKPLAELALSDWKAGFWTPTRHFFGLARRAVSEFLVGGEGGRLVLVAPPLPREGAGCAESAAQTALFAFARSIAKEYGRRAITCNFVTAGPEAADTAQIALFLASEAAAFVSGETLDAGQRRET